MSANVWRLFVATSVVWTLAGCADDLPRPLDMTASAHDAGADLSVQMSCPATMPSFSDGPCSDGLRCSYATDAAMNAHCDCLASRWRCGDCPWGPNGEPPMMDYACSAPGTSCDENGQEFSYTCLCYPNGRAHCCSSDAASAATAVPDAPCCLAIDRSPQSIASDGGMLQCSCAQDQIWHCI